ncbi:MAG: hypothetical protein ACKV2T_16500 [Kofleriaceae bacterium]
MKLQFLRALLPSWRFFDRAAPSPQLFVRVAGGAWTPFAGGSRPAFSPLFAPSANLHLAYTSVVEQLVAELGDLDLDGDAPADGLERDPRVTELVGYELVARIAETQVTAGESYQWKIVVAGDDYIASPERTAPWRSTG